MKQQLQERLKELRAEYSAGKRELSELEDKEATVKQTLERIKCAIQRIEEELKSAQ